MLPKKYSPAVKLSYRKSKLTSDIIFLGYLYAEPTHTPVKNSSILFVPILIVILAACAGSNHTFSDKDNKIDLQQYKTYAWIAPGDTVLNAKRKDKLFGGYIVRVSDEELNKKGMTVNTTHPDAVFMFETQIQERVEYSQAPTMSVGVGYGGPGYYVGGSVPVAGGEIKSTQVQDGMLTFKMYDTKSGNLIWTGGTRETITNSVDVEDVISKAVKQIFYRLPIHHKSK